MKTDQWWDVNWNPLKGCPDNGACECADICWAYGPANKKSMSYRYHRKNELSFDPDLAIPKGEGKVIFANNTSDLGYPDISDTIRAEVYGKMLDKSNHIWVNLTKRPNVLAKFFALILSERTKLSLFLKQHSDHIWQGVSVTSQDTMWRLDVLRNQIPLKHKLVSLEPLREPLPNLDLSGINWVIVGPDSSKTWPCEAEWVINIVEQCQAAKVPVFVKGVKYLKNYSAPSPDITSNLVDITPMVWRALVLNTQEYPIWK